MTHVAFVGIGANVGDPEGQVRRALADLAALGAVLPSGLYRTEPVGDRRQPWFVNAVARLRTRLEPRPLLSELRRLERAAGRPDRRPGGDPRTLDLDLLLYDDRVVDDPDLRLPHPRMHTRRFVLEPLCEIAPGARDPRTGLTMAEVLGSLDDPARVEPMGPGARGETEANWVNLNPRKAPVEAS